MPWHTSLLRSHLLHAVCAGCVLTVYLNTGLFHELLTNGTWDTPIAQNLMNEDEARYTSRIRSIMDGELFIGNPNLLEHAGGIAPGGLVEWLVALPARALNMRIATAIALSDVVFPLLVLAVTWLWMLSVFKKKVVSWALVLLFIFIHWDAPGGLLRESSPKMSMLVAMLYLLVVFWEWRRDWVQWLLRGLLLGCMFYTYLYHWTWFVVFEAALLAYDAWKDRLTLRMIVLRGMAVFGVFGLLVLPYAVALRVLVDPGVLETTAQHFALIPTRFPAAPALSAKILVCLALMAIAVYRQRDRSVTYMLLLVAAGLVAVNSNVITGKEAEFLGHYDRVMFVAFVPAVFLLARSVAPRLLTALAVLSIVYCVVYGSTRVPALVAYGQESLSRFQANEAGIMEWVSGLPPQQVILAPSQIADRIPALEDQYVFMNDAAHFFFVPEQELVNRYIVQVFFFPEEAQPTDQGTMAVFGNYPGSLWSKTRAVERLFHPSRPFQKTQADFIFNQSLRMQLDAALAEPSPADVRRFLRQYRLDYLVTKTPLPESVSDLFRYERSIHPYTVYAMALERESP